AGLGGRELAATVDLVAGIHATGVTTIVVEHVEQVVRSLVTRVIVLDWGRQIAEGSPEEVRSDARVRSVYLGTAAEGARPAAAVDRSSSGSAPLVELRGVTAGYGELTAVRDLDLRLEASGAVAVLGAN